MIYSLWQFIEMWPICRIFLVGESLNKARLDLANLQLFDVWHKENIILSLKLHFFKNQLKCINTYFSNCPSRVCYELAYWSASVADLKPQWLLKDCCEFFRLLINNYFFVVRNLSHLSSFVFFLTFLNYK